ncbi:hypothetical protein BD769DRAFT_1660840 [Suillus cothurnatus]|nr:hypothetical protein BD769DRAFT_1660840 [Suillus cothurnatus]
MSSPDIEVKCFSQCVTNSVYDHVADAITSLGKNGLGKADFSIDWTTTVQDNYSGTNWSYVNTKDGCPFRTNIVGHIATSTCGRKHSAKGTHFTKKTFQLSVQAMKVLDPSDKPVKECLIPILSTTSIDMSKDDSAIATFLTFDITISPAKKKSKGGKGKEKEKTD